MGGRTSTRRVLVDGHNVVGPDVKEGTHAWDHGCQMFRADTAEFRDTLLAGWLEKEYAAEWKGRFEAIDGGDFFGVTESHLGPIYCGVGGMCGIVEGLVRGAEVGGAVVHSGVRVGSVESSAEGGGRKKWLLRGVSGARAFHDTKDNEGSVADREKDLLGDFDAVVITDASAAMDSWHRASAGLPREFLDGVGGKVTRRARVALFSALVAFERPLSSEAAAAFAIGGSSPVWFAARTASKPGFEDVESECWTLVSTPEYAAGEIDRVKMRDEKTGEFLPQDPEYLTSEGGPARVLLAAFEEVLGGGGLPPVLYLGGQRWGSAFPAPKNSEGRNGDGKGAGTVSVCGVDYDASSSMALIGEEGGAGEGDDFVDGGDLDLFYCGDFASGRAPGVEAAALSAVHCAEAVAKKYNK